MVFVFVFGVFHAFPVMPIYFGLVRLDHDFNEGFNKNIKSVNGALFVIQTINTNIKKTNTKE